jgi:hypothetical protein
MHLGIERQPELLRHKERCDEMDTIRVNPEHHGRVEISHLLLNNTLQVVIRHERQATPEPVPQSWKTPRKHQGRGWTRRRKRRI